MKGFYIRFCQKNIFSFATWKGNYQRKVFGATQYIDPKLNIGPLENKKKEIQEKLNDYYFKSKTVGENDKLEEKKEGKAKVVYQKIQDVKNNDQNLKENLFYNPTLVII